MRGSQPRNFVQVSFWVAVRRSLVSVRAPCSAACRSSQQRSSNARTVRREAQLRNDAHFCDSVTHLGSKHGVMLIQTCAALTCVRGDAGVTHTTM